MQAFLSNVKGVPCRSFHDEDGRGFRTQWDAIQTGFVDQPTAVEQDTFGSERAMLEEQWSRGQEASTEDLRIALKRYRSFFERLLSI